MGIGWDKDGVRGGDGVRDGIRMGMGAGMG